MIVLGIRQQPAAEINTQIIELEIPGRNLICQLAISTAEVKNIIGWGQALNDP